MHIWLEIMTRHFGVFRMTQTVTQKPRGQESTGEGRMASSVPLRLFFVGYMVWLMTLPMVSAAERFIPSVAWVWVLCVFLHRQEYRQPDRHPKTKL